MRSHPVREHEVAGPRWRDTVGACRPVPDLLNYFRVSVGAQMGISTSFAMSVSVPTEAMSPRGASAKFVTRPGHRLRPYDVSSYAVAPVTEIPPPVSTHRRGPLST